MHLRFNFDACPMHSPFGFVHLMHQNLSARALFCLNSLAKANTQLLLYNWESAACLSNTGDEDCIGITANLDRIIDIEKISQVFYHIPSTILGKSSCKQFWNSALLKGCISYAAINGLLELTLLKVRQRFDTVSTSNLKVYKIREWWIFT